MPQPYRLYEFVGAYLLSLMMVIAIFIFAQPLGIFAYFGCGLLLSRFISHRVIWWRQADSIENVYLAKIDTFLRWPIAVPIFVWKLAIAKVL